VAIKTDLTKSLIDEGVSRELVHHIQNMRKSAGLNISDHIILKYVGNKNIQEIIHNHLDYVSSETLADEVESATPEDDFYIETFNVDAAEVILGIKRHA